MGVRLYPAREGDYDYDELRERLREADVNPGIKVSASDVEETAGVAERLGVDPTPLRDVLGVPNERVGRDYPRRLDRQEIQQLDQFCDALLVALDEAIDFQAIQETEADLPPGETVRDHLDRETAECYDAYYSATTLGRLCEKAIAWEFPLELR